MAELSGEALERLARTISGRLQAVVPEGAFPSIGVKVWMLPDNLVNQSETSRATS